MPTYIRPIGAFNRALLTLPAQRYGAYGPFSRKQFAGYAMAILAVLSATVVRWAVDDQLPPGFPFLTFFPAVVIVAFVYGLYAGVLSAVLSAFASSMFMVGEPTLVGKIFTFGFFAMVVGVDIFLIHIMHAALSQLSALHQRAQELADERALFVDELSHRIKNLLANVAALISVASRHARDVPSLVNSVRSRLDALGRVSSLLQRNLFDTRVSLVDLIKLSTAAVEDASSIEIEDASLGCTLASGDATSLSLIFHELATNAVKYGALSAPGQSVRVSGEVRNEMFVVHWREQFLAPGTTQPGSGFGRVLLDRVSRSLGGKLEVISTDNSYHATLAVPMSRCMLYAAQAQNTASPPLSMSRS